MSYRTGRRLSFTNRPVFKEDENDRFDYPCRMKTILTDRRHLGERRWGLSFGFPIHDSRGVLVINDRRKIPERRLANTTLEERLLMFSGAVSTGNDPDRH